MNKNIQYKVLFLSLLFISPAYPVGRNNHFLQSRFNQVLLACAAGGIGWKLYTYLWHRHYTQIQDKAKAYLERLEKRYADVFDLHKKVAADTEQNKYQAFSAFILKEDPTDKQFAGFLERLQKSINKIDEYLKALPEIKDLEQTRESLEIMKKKVVEIKTVVTRFNEAAQLERSMHAVETSFTQEFTIIHGTASLKQKKHEIKEIIHKSKPKTTDLRYVAYDQKLSSYLLSLRRCASFSIFKNIQDAINYGTQHAHLQKLIKDLEQVQAIVHSSHAFQSEEQIQKLRDQVKDQQEKIRKLLATTGYVYSQAYQQQYMHNPTSTDNGNKIRR
jgi:hypothetical protein